MHCTFAISIGADGRFVHECLQCGQQVVNIRRLSLVATCRVKRDGPCVHLGRVELRRELCESCGGKTQIKVFGCAAFRECTLGKKLPGLACCDGCQRWESAAPSEQAGANG
jgi:hypothetical protein